MSIYDCPICGNKYGVPPYNPTNSPVLLVGESPEAGEVARGIPLVGRTGTILRQQLAHLGYDLSSFGVCNLWQHEPPSAKNKINPDCITHGKKVVIEEAKDKKLILLIGSEVANHFLEKNVSELNGLIVNEFLSVPLSAPVVMALYNPSICFHGVLGEVILGLKNFIREVEKL